MDFGNSLNEYKSYLSGAEADDYDEDYKETTHIWFLGLSYGPNMVGRMLNEKRKAVLVSSLQSIEPKVRDIRIGSILEWIAFCRLTILEMGYYVF